MLNHWINEDEKSERIEYDMISNLAVYVEENEILDETRTRRTEARINPRRYALPIFRHCLAHHSSVLSLSAFRFISPSRVMIWWYLPWWRTAKQREAVCSMCRCTMTGHRKYEKWSYISVLMLTPRMKIRHLTRVIKFRW